MPIGVTTGYKNSAGVDIGESLVPSSYLTDRYPELVNNMRFAGLWTWGANQPSQAQLGDNTIVKKSSPVQTVAGGTNWKQVAGGGSHTAAIKTDGTLWTWGYSAFGQSGNNTTIQYSSPVQTIAAGTNWKQVSAGGNHTAAIKTDGTLWTWGYNNYGQLGDNTSNGVSSPIQTIAAGTNWKQVSCGLYHTAAIKTDGTLWTWGGSYNNPGQLGDNTTVSKSSPVQTIAGGTNWKLVACGQYHIAAIKTDGTLWVWGQNTNGQLGDNTITNKSSPVQTIAAGTNWKQVGGGGNHTSAIKTDGTLWVWGQNTNGQLGDNTITNKSSPVQTIAGGTNWRSISSGWHTSAIKTDGTLWVWGQNTNGQLGDNTITNKSSPVQTIAAGTNWKLVAAGFGNHTVAIRDDSNDYI